MKRKITAFHLTRSVRCLKTLSNRSKSDFLAGTFAKLAKVLPAGTQLHVTNAMLCGDWAMVELASLATAKNGLRFDNKYCWLCRFENDKIAEVRAYPDSAMVQRLFDENPISDWTGDGCIGPL